MTLTPPRCLVPCEGPDGTFYLDLSDIVVVYPVGAFRPTQDALVHSTVEVRRVVLQNGVAVDLFDTPDLLERLLA